MAKQLTGRQMLEDIIAIAAGFRLRREDFSDDMEYREHAEFFHLECSTRPNSLGYCLSFSQEIYMPKEEKETKITLPSLYIGDIVPFSFVFAYGKAAGESADVGVISLARGGELDAQLKNPLAIEALQLPAGKIGEIDADGDANVNMGWKAFARKLFRHYVKHLNPED